jgi:hypothetical protein
MYSWPLKSHCGYLPMSPLGNYCSSRPRIVYENNLPNVKAFFLITWRYACDWMPKNPKALCIQITSFLLWRVAREFAYMIATVTSISRGMAIHRYQTCYISFLFWLLARIKTFLGPHFYPTLIHTNVALKKNKELYSLHFNCVTYCNREIVLFRLMCRLFLIPYLFVVLNKYSML